MTGKNSQVPIQQTYLNKGKLRIHVFSQTYVLNCTWGWGPCHQFPSSEELNSAKSSLFTWILAVCLQWSC